MYAKSLIAILMQEFVLLIRTIQIHATSLHSSEINFVKILALISKRSTESVSFVLMCNNIKSALQKMKRKRLNGTLETSDTFRTLHIRTQKHLISGLAQG